MHAVVPLQTLLLLHGRPLVGGRCLFSNAPLYDWFYATFEVTFDATTTLGAEFHAELSVSFPWRWRNSLRFPTTKSPARGPAFLEMPPFCSAIAWHAQPRDPGCRTSTFQSLRGSDHRDLHVIAGPDQWGVGAHAVAAFVVIDCIGLHSSVLALRTTSAHSLSWSRAEIYVQPTQSCRALRVTFRLPPRSRTSVRKFRATRLESAFQYAPSTFRRIPRSLIIPLEMAELVAIFRRGNHPHEAPHFPRSCPWNAIGRRAQVRVVACCRPGKFQSLRGSEHRDLHVIAILTQ